MDELVEGFDLVVCGMLVYEVFEVFWCEVCSL